MTYLLACVIPSQAFIHAYNNGLLSSMYASLPFQKHRLLISRVTALALNGIALALATQGLNVQGLTVIPNMMGATLGFPLFLSICSAYFYKRATGGIIIASSLAGLIGCCVCGVLYVRR